MVATLTIGLRDDSRVKKKISGQKLTIEQSLLAFILDDLNLILWSKSKRRGAKPKSIYKKLTEEKARKDELRSFDTPEDYEAWMRSKREKWNNG